MFTLVGCFGYSLPDEVHLNAANRAACAGGLKASFRVGSLTLEANAPVEATITTSDWGLRPADAPAGTLATTEAWCYGEAGTELGYARIELPWHAPVINIPVVNVFSHEASESYEGCLPTVEKRGQQAPCVQSELLN